jgi:hypothetical protein
MTGPMRAASSGAGPAEGSSRPRSAVRSRSCQCQPAATPRIQTVRAARDLGGRGQHPFPGGSRGIGVGRRLGWLLVVVDAGPRAHAPCRGPGGLRGAWLTTAWLCSWSWLVSMCPQCWPCRSYRVTCGMVVLVQLGLMAVAVGHGEPPPVRPCLPEPHPGCRSSIPQLTAKLTANPPDTPGPRRIALGRLYTS